MNRTIHKITVPLLLMTAYASFPIYATNIIHLFYSAHYLLYDMFSQNSINIFSVLQIIYIFHIILRQNINPSYLYGVHFISWAMQLAGHAFYEKNKTAFINNLYDSLLFAPYFAFSEILQLTAPELDPKRNIKRTIVYREYNPSKKSILYFAGAFQKSESVFGTGDKTDHNHIYITCRFSDQDNFKQSLKGVLQDLLAFDSEIDRKIECIVGYSFGGVLAVEMKKLFIMYCKCDGGGPPKCILISPGGFFSNTWVEFALRTIAGILYTCYRTDKWYVLQQYPQYQNTNDPDYETNYHICSRSDWIHNAYYAQYTHLSKNNMILYDNAGHWGILDIIKRQRIIPQLIERGFQTDTVRFRVGYGQWNRVLFGGYGGQFYYYLVGTLLSKYPQLQWIDSVFRVVPFWTFMIRPCGDEIVESHLQIDSKVKQE